MKKITGGFVFILILIGLFAVNVVSSKQNNVLKIDDTDECFENEFILSDGRLYVPIRELCERLGISVFWNIETEQAELHTQKEAVHTTEQTKLDNDEVIPDEKTAYKIGKLLLERHCGESLEYEKDGLVYYLHVFELKDANAWKISQTFRAQNGGGGYSGAYAPQIVLDKATGKVISINTYSEINGQ